MDQKLILEKKQHNATSWALGNESRVDSKKLLVGVEKNKDVLIEGKLKNPVLFRKLLSKYYNSLILRTGDFSLTYKITLGRNLNRGSILEGMILDDRRHPRDGAIIAFSSFTNRLIIYDPLISFENGVLSFSMFDQYMNVFYRLELHDMLKDYVNDLSTSIFVDFNPWFMREFNKSKPEKIVITPNTIEYWTGNKNLVLPGQNRTDLIKKIRVANNLLDKNYKNETELTTKRVFEDAIYHVRLGALGGGRIEYPLIPATMDDYKAFFGFGYSYALPSRFGVDAYYSMAKIFGLLSKTDRKLQEEITELIRKRFGVRDPLKDAEINNLIENKQYELFKSVYSKLSKKKIQDYSVPFQYQNPLLGFVNRSIKQVSSFFDTSMNTSIKWDENGFCVAEIPLKNTSGVLKALLYPQEIPGGVE